MEEENYISQERIKRILTTPKKGLNSVFAVVMGLVLDAAGFEKEIKNVTVKGGHQDGMTWEKLQGSFWQKQMQAFKFLLLYSIGHSTNLSF